jgi:hypothetical protein
MKVIQLNAGSLGRTKILHGVIRDIFLVCSGLYACKEAAVLPVSDAMRAR